MKKLIATALAVLAVVLPGAATAQPGPGPVPDPWIVNGNTINPGGLKVITTAPTTGAAGFNLPQGTTPSAPVNGDLWTTAVGLFARINGSTVGPFSSNPVTGLANPTAVVGPTAVNGSATTAMRSDAAPALGPTAVSAGTYGSATQSPSFTVDAQGRLTAAANNPIAGSSFIQGGTGAATRTMQNKVRETVSVLDYTNTGLAAVCGGVDAVDDSVAINKGVTYLGANGGGDLLFPPFTDCRIKNPINAVAGVHLVGQGALNGASTFASAIIYPSANLTAMILQPDLATPISDWGMDGITLYGRKGTYTVTNLVRVSALNSFIKNSNITNGSGNCIQWDAAATPAWLNDISGNRGIGSCNGFGLSFSGSDSRIINNEFGGSALGNVYLVGSGSNNFVSNRVETSAAWGLIVQTPNAGDANCLGGNNTSQNTIADNIFAENETGMLIQKGTCAGNATSSDIIAINIFTLSTTRDIEADSGILNAHIGPNIHTKSSPSASYVGFIPGTTNTGWTLEGTFGSSTLTENAPGDLKIDVSGSQQAFRRASGTFTNLTVTNPIVGSITGNAATATALQNARTIGGVSFNGTANITVASATGGFTVSGGDLALGANNLTMTGSIGATGARVLKGWFTDLQVTNAIAGSITGNAATVTTNANMTGDVTSVGNATTLAAGNAGNLNSGTVLAARMPALTGDVTTSAGAVATTLATVNANVGTFGSATQASQVTVNAKGLVTAAANVTVTPAVGSITGLGTGVAPALGQPIGSAGAPVLFNGAGGTPSSIMLTNGTGLPTTGLTGTLQAAQEPAHTGDVTNSAGSLALALVNIPTATPMVGSLLATNIAAPSSPAAGKVSVYADSTDLRFHDKNASGVIGTTVVADTGASNNFLTAISAAGVISKAQPAFTNLSGSLACGQIPALTGDVTTSAGSCATTLAAGSASNLNSGTLASARLTGSYTGVTGLGTVTTGVWNAGAVTSSGAVQAAAFSGFNLGSVLFAQIDVGGYTQIADGGGLQALTLGSTDPGNFYTNTTHTFRNRLATVNYMTMSTGATGIRFNGYGAGTLATDASGVISASDERLKDIVSPFKGGIASLQKMDAPIIFKWKSERETSPDSVYVGWTAQGVRRGIPEAVKAAPDGTLNYDDRAILAALWNSVMELKSDNDNIRDDVDRLKRAAR